MPAKEPDQRKHSPQRKQREIRTMRDAVEEMRNLGEGNADDAQGAEKPPRPKRKRARRKKRGAGFTSSFPFFSFFTSDKRTRHTRGRKFTIFGRQVTFWSMFLLAFVVTMVSVFFLTSTNLTTGKQDITLVGLPDDLENYKILVLSDLNGKRFGDGQSTLLHAIGTLDYDIVVCLGDMVGKDGDPTPFYELLDGLPSKKQVFFVCGDSDPGPFVSQVRDESAALDRLVLADWILGAMDRGATYVDKPTKVSVGNTSLWLTPANMLNLEASSALSDWKEQVAQEESGYLSGILSDKATLPFSSYRLQCAQALVDAINAMSASDVQISLSHVPAADDVLEAAATHSSDPGKYLPTPDVALAGHYCGGVWNLPILGAFYIPDSSAPRYGWLPDQSRVSGLREINETQLYVTRGLSTSGDTPLMPFRLLNRPEISVVTLTATLPTSMLE